MGWVVGLRPIVASGSYSLQGKYPLWESFWGILARIYASFGENQGKFRMARSTNTTGDWTWYIPFTSFEHRTALSLVEQDIHWIRTCIKVLWYMFLLCVVNLIKLQQLDSHYKISLSIYIIFFLLDFLQLYIFKWLKQKFIKYQGWKKKRVFFKKTKNPGFFGLNQAFF